MKRIVLGVFGVVLALSAVVTFERPAAMPSAITRATRSQERMASSFPGMT